MAPVNGGKVSTKAFYDELMALRDERNRDHLALVDKIDDISTDVAVLNSRFDGVEKLDKRVTKVEDNQRKGNWLAGGLAGLAALLGITLN